MKTFTRIALLFLMLNFTLAHSIPVFAEDVGTNVNEAAKDTKKAVRKGARKVRDKTCEMVDGKLNCAAKKLKHKVQNAGDDVSDKVDDLKK